MNTDQINKYSAKLCEDIKFKYLQDFCKKDGNWFNSCQKSMHDFVLSRSGWLRSDKSDDSFLFNDKYPITVNVLYDGSPGDLLINTAVNIAKAELVNMFDENDNLEEVITQIAENVKKQDWIIPFVRKKAV